MARPGLYANIHAKRKRGGKMRKKGAKGAPKASDFVRKFKVYPSAYANAYASKICAGKIKDPSGVKRKDFRGPKPAGKKDGGRINFKNGGIARGCGKVMSNRRKVTKVY
jgi:hypothetical protein